MTDSGPLALSEPLALLERTFDSAAENVALDEVLLAAVDGGREAPLLRLWEPDRHAVVVGRSNRVAKNVDLDACRRDGVPVVRRFSGGGTVLLGPGALVFSLVLNTPPSGGVANVDAATAAVMNRVLAAFGDRVPRLERKGTSDLAAGELKVSGNAQRWLRSAFLHHGTLLYDFDLDRIGRYLTPPEREPDYRRNRPHRDFVRNLPLNRAELRSVLIGGWNAVGPPPQVPLDAVAVAVRERYGRDDWTYRL